MMPKLKLNLLAKKLVFVAKRIFSHKNIKKALGANLVLIMIASSSFGSVNAFTDNSQAEITLDEEEIPLTTQNFGQYPTPMVRITQGFRFFHPGIDLDGKTGDPIKPIKAGRVLAISFSRYTYGNAVIIEHEAGLESLYAHLSEIEVEPGDEVSDEDIIGKMGNTGRSFGDHLHLEISLKGRKIDPLSILPKVKYLALKNK